MVMEGRNGLKCSTPSLCRRGGDVQGNCPGGMRPGECPVSVNSTTEKKFTHTVCIAFSYSWTSSSAVAQRPRDVSCLSVASIGPNTKRQCILFLLVTQATDLSLRTIKCRSVVFGVTLRLLVIHFVVVSRHQQTLPLTSDSPL